MTSIWKDRRVVVTGHTGFKGTWLSAWLCHLGAKVTGYSLEPITNPSLFALSGMENKLDHHIGDIRSGTNLENILRKCQPEIIFHLAAQPLVRESYLSPAETFDINVTGTARLLEVAKSLESTLGVVVVTTDKVYKNREWNWGYRENDELGGHDPYSASKACAELVVESFRKSFCSRDGVQKTIQIASARAGNVIGGGDWSKDRLIPDIIRAVNTKTVLPIRNPDSVRPWQHLLEPLGAYLLLGEKLLQKDPFAGDAFNIGPSMTDCVSVRKVLSSATKAFGSRLRIEMDESQHPHEAGLLKLDCSKINTIFNWQPHLSLEKALQWTFDWYKEQALGKVAFSLMQSQIQMYENILNQEKKS